MMHHYVSVAIHFLKFQILILFISFCFKIMLILNVIWDRTNYF